MTGDTLLRPLLTRRGLQALWLIVLIYQLARLAIGIVLLLQWLPQFRGNFGLPAPVAAANLSHVLLAILAPLMELAAARMAVAVADTVLFGARPGAAA